MEDKFKDFFEGLKKVHETGTSFINSVKENITQAETLSEEEKDELETKFTEEPEYIKIAEDMDILWAEIAKTLT